MQRSQSFSQLQAVNNEIPICIFIKNNANYCNEQIKAQKATFEQTFALHTLQCISPIQKYQNYALGNVEIKKGILQLKINTGGFKKVNAILTREKLKFLEDNQQSKVYNLKYLSFNVTQCMKNSFILFKVNFPSAKMLFTFKCSNEIDGKLWFQCFKMIEERFCNEIEKLFIGERYFGLDIIRESEFLSCAETGDILLFETDHYMAKLQRGVTGSNFDHVGMVVRGKCDGEILVFDVRNLTGVDFEYWKYYIKTNDLFIRVAFRKLLNVNREEIDFKMREFTDKAHGSEFELNLGKLLQFQSNGLIKRGYFCSELIAKAYKYCGLLLPSKASTYYWPVTFSKQMKLLGSAELSDPITIVMENDIYNQQ